MNYRAFNLFTALVAFIMILLSVILTNSMTRTEDKAIATLSDLESQSEMQAIADLVRGDALQVFVYNLRYKMESWLTKQENYFPVEKGKTLNDLVGAYIQVNFGNVIGTDPNGNPITQNQQFAFEVTKQLSATLSKKYNFDRYAVELQQNDEAMLRALNQTIGRSIADIQHQSFFEPIECSNERSCTGGTFYVALDLSKGAFNPNCDPSGNPNSTDCQEDDSVYEGLPKVIVRKISTGEVLETAILPRSKVKIYVPLRIFKAVAQAKVDADQTVFRDEIFESLGKIRMGLCDTASCYPRKDDLSQARNESQWTEAACPTRSADISVNLAFQYDIGGVMGSGQYQPRISSMEPKLKDVVRDVFCENAQALVPTHFTNPLTAVGVTPPTPLRPACDVLGSLVQTIPSKQVSVAGTTSTGDGICTVISRVTLELQYPEQDPLYRVNKNINRPYTIRVSLDPVPTPTIGGNCRTQCDLAGNCSCSV